MRDRIFYAYIMASRSKTLYVGFTSGIEKRTWQHKNDVFGGFSKQYQCHRLVFFERFTTAAAGIAREKQLKRWSRDKKIALIEKTNPGWADLSEKWFKPEPPSAGPADFSTSPRDEAARLRSK